jgi:lysophospholipid acyltransferase (LPLAT)-like uncharacterized protein
VPQRLKWHGKLAAFSAFVLIKMISSTWRMKWEDHSPSPPGKEAFPVLFCVWHNRLAISMVTWKRFRRTRQPNSRLAALISASKDGALLARILEYFNVQPFRGSSSRRGAQALLEVTTWVKQGQHVAITPDGPRGPRYKLQEGIIALAQLTGRPIIPIGAHMHPKIQSRGWDQFQIPLPFARCRVMFDHPFYVPADISPEEREDYRLRLEQRMVAINQD